MRACVRVAKRSWHLPISYDFVKHDSIHFVKRTELFKNKYLPLSIGYFLLILLLYNSILSIATPVPFATQSSDSSAT